MTLDCFNSNNI